MKLRDRIKELRRVPANSLRPNPKNWRTHPPAQSDALKGALAEVGIAEALVARELPDGTLELIDGHLRAETCGTETVPVLVLDVSEAEAAYLLATLDPMAELAGADTEKLDAALREISTQSEGVSQMLSGLAEKHGVVPPEEETEGEPYPDLAPRLEILVKCRDEAHQREVFERLQRDGLECRVLTA